MGPFAGFDVCSIFVFRTPISNFVFKVIVQFPSLITREQSKNDYLALADGLMKYGKPQKKVGFDTFTPYALWVLPMGTIELRSNGYRIDLTYEDSEYAGVYKIEKQKQEESMVDTSDL